METTLPLTKVENGYEVYSVADLEDGTFLEIPWGAFGLLLDTTPEGRYEVGLVAWMRYQSYFLGTAEVGGTTRRILRGIFGEGKGCDSFVLTEDDIKCRILPS